MEPLAFTTSLDLPFATAADRVAEALKAEGFGVLSTIDVQTIFRDKLGESFRPYTILGVCNPGLAHRALSGDPEAGLLLPCTVTIEETAPDRSVVRIANPEAMLKVGTFPDGSPVRTVATEARSRLARVAAALAGRG